MQIDGLEPHYQIILDQKDGYNTVDIQVEATDRIQSIDKVGTILMLKQKLQKQLENTLQIKANVTFVEKKTIKRSEGNKTRHIIDRRKNHD